MEGRALVQSQSPAHADRTVTLPCLTTGSTGTIDIGHYTWLLVGFLNLKISQEWEYSRFFRNSRSGYEQHGVS